MRSSQEGRQSIRRDDLKCNEANKPRRSDNAHFGRESRCPFHEPSRHVANAADALAQTRPEKRINRHDGDQGGLETVFRRSVQYHDDATQHKDMTRNDHDRPTGPARQVPGQGRDPAARRRRTSPFDRVEQPPPKKKHPGQPGFVRRAVSEHQWTASAPAVTRHLACLQSCASSGHAGRAAMFWMPASSAAARNAPLPSRPFAQTSPTAVALRFNVIPTRPAFDLQKGSDEGWPSGCFNPAGITTR